MATEDLSLPAGPKSLGHPLLQGGGAIVARVASLLPAPPVPQPRRPVRGFLLGPAIWCALVFVTAAIAAALPGASDAAVGRGRSYSAPTTAVLMREAGLWSGFAVLTLLFLVLAVGSPAVLGRQQSVAATARASVAVFALANTSSVLLGLAFDLASDAVPRLTHYASANPTSNGPYLAEGVLSAAAGFSEEVMAVACPVVVVAAVLPRIGRRGMVALVAVLAAVRIAYHSEYFVLASVLVPWAVIMVVIFARSRALVAMMLAHMAYDVMVDSMGPIRAWCGTGAAWTCELGLCALAWWVCLRWTKPGRRTASDVTAGKTAVPG